jgi:glutamyl endopeptidase
MDLHFSKEETKMSDTTPVTGLHTPITNIAPTESTVIAPMLSPGSTGFGDEAQVEEDAIVEAVRRMELEAAVEVDVELTAPDLSGLEDIGVASFGAPPQLETVLGIDERVPVTNTKQYPWRLSASLLITAADNSQWIGTGWFISPRTLVTAGHCVYIKGSSIPGRDGWVKKIQVMPGRNGTVLPFGGISATEFWTVQGWGEKGLENYDYGAIILPAVFPEDMGFFAFGVFEDERLLQATVNIAGYPGDKPRGTLWYDHRQVGSINPDKVYYAADTAGGQSGACVYIFNNGERTAIAIHAYGGNTANSGTRISSQVFSNLEAWKRT